MILSKRLIPHIGTRVGLGPIASAFLSVLVIAGAILLPGHAAAQISLAEGQRIYVDLGRWTIVEDARPNRCVLHHATRDGVVVTMSKVGTNDAQLSLQFLGRNVMRPTPDIVFAFDEDEFPVRPSQMRVFTPEGDASAIESAFRSARVMTLRNGGASVVTISLDGSSSGFRLLKQCAEEGRLGQARAEVAPPPASPPPLAEPEPEPATAPRAAASTLPPPPSLARPPVPRNPQGWVRESDVRRAGDDEGTVRYTLIVNSDGRAEECIVDANSGPRSLAALACRTLIRRSRFEPAHDPNGNPTPGRWSSAITFRSPTSGAN